VSPLPRRCAASAWAALALAGVSGAGAAELRADTGAEPPPTQRAPSPEGPRVGLSGTMAQMALLVIDGGPPRTVRAGEAVQGIRVISVGAGEAVVEVGGQRRSLRVGDAPAIVGGVGRSAGTKIVLSASSGGHFLSSGSINGKAVQFLVDTGATLVAIGEAEAQSLGLDYKNGARVTMRTAGGDVLAWHLRLASVRLGDVEISNVDAVVQPTPLPYVLLGNSFLTRFQMRRENDLLTLERRY
jgi:aspartyl protease family protein